MQRIALAPNRRSRDTPYGTRGPSTGAEEGEGEKGPGVDMSWPAAGGVACLVCCGGRRAKPGGGLGGAVSLAFPRGRNVAVVSARVRVGDRGWMRLRFYRRRARGRLRTVGCLPLMVVGSGGVLVAPPPGRVSRLAPGAWLPGRCPAR